MTSPLGDKLPSELEEEKGVRTELIGRLRQHGVRLTPEVIDRADDTSLADLLTAVEEFEDAVEEAGGDLFVDTPESSKPDDPRFVLPRARDGETVDGYRSRIMDRTTGLQG